MRELSVPERFAVAGAAAAALATVTPLLRTAGGIAVPCLLRLLTGVPCPACGLTTATERLVVADLAGAAAANPLVFGLAGTALTGGLALLGRWCGRRGAPRPWSAAARRRTAAVVGVLAAASWLYQLHRFHWL